METTTNHINSGGGICGTCACIAHATPENEGYSDCCNDRIEYGDEALGTLRQAEIEAAKYRYDATGSDADRWALDALRNS